MLELKCKRPSIPSPPSASPTARLPAPNHSPAAPRAAAAANKIGPAGATALGEALRVNTRLTALELGCAAHRPAAPPCRTVAV